MATIDSTLPGLDPGKVWFMCLSCGAPRQAKAGYMGDQLRCAGECQGATRHQRVGLGREDGREQANRAQDAERRRLAAAEHMLAALGIRVRRLPLDDEDVSVWAVERQGRTDYSIDLNLGLDVREQIKALKKAWHYLLPLNDDRWLDRAEWGRWKSDPQVRSMGLVWRRDHG